MAIDLEKIEKAYIRFKLLADNLMFRVSTIPKPDNPEYKDTKEYFEVRCNSRFVFSSKDKGDCETLALRLNIALTEVMQEEYDAMMNSMKEAET